MHTWKAGARDGDMSDWWSSHIAWLSLFCYVQSRSVSVSPSAEVNLLGWRSEGGRGWVWCWGWGWIAEESDLFFSSGVKGGRSCVQTSWQKALLCAAYADRGGSFVHRWRSHAWVCLRRRGKGGRREECWWREGRGVSGTECHHCVWWGRGHREPSQPGPTKFIQ